ncbi:class I SAM-dependent methyltransferase [Prochlorococcus sp. MIT 1341]|uniref:class I SAM-dependent methyltransferase n=1 Tax=Prochlorococcus sp. MIT 1341 TaxID=3096221 RepID=UPI002A7666DE|nr:class I SAM-dependent methyltransferase [Prochlorococcus sp. MIT 1341]
MGGLINSFFLSHFPHATITCVDTWEWNSDDNKFDLQVIESNFNKNTYPFHERITKFKGTSYSYFESNQQRNYFDLIYIDGSYVPDDLIIDAFKSFQALAIGGLMIFEYYIWIDGRPPKDRPIEAINSFLSIKKGCYKIVQVYSQLIIQKIK